MDGGNYCILDFRNRNTPTNVVQRFFIVYVRASYKKCRKVGGASFRSARFEGLISEVLLIWRFFTNRTHIFLASSVSTVSFISTHSFLNL
jgi:hypothetical protein